MKEIVCIFCQKQKEKSKEHIWPRWLQTLIGGTEQSFYQGVHLSPIFPISTRIHSGESLVYGHVCNECNNGWMSKLEAECKPLIIKLIINRHFIDSLSKTDRQKISLWAFKTALIINAGSNYRKIIPDSHYSHLYRHQIIIKNVKIDIGFLPSEKALSWRQSQISFGLMHQNDKENFHELLKNSYKVSLQINNIGIRVSFFPHVKEFGYKISFSEKEKNLRIWPYQKNSLFNSKLEYESLDDFDLDCSVIPI
ncbi:MAG: hypothetical protein A2X05_12710 [Bacteroidetes bacterium GWE2_41_25]|nr:MAG: hypothetical protein A2X05_12710 [Bacteroidetes bacterium GWE2_41_25]